MHDPASVDDPLHERGRLGGDDVAQRQRAERIALASDRRLLLDRDRQPVERPDRLAAAGVPASAALAASSASSNRDSAKALMAGSTASARAITASSNSTGESSLLRNFASASVADR